MKMFYKIYIFLGQDPDPLIHDTDPKIRIWILIKIRTRSLSVQL